MAPILPQSTPIPSTMLASWQNMLNLLAEILKVPATMIMRLHHHEFDVYCTNTSSENPYRIGMTEQLGKGLYCETVVNTRQILIVTNAETDPLWKDNPSMEFGMRAYCGIPLQWPNGDLFGTLCATDRREHHFHATDQQLIRAFRESIEAQLKTLYQRETLLQMNQDLHFKVRNKMQSIASLNQSLHQEIDKRRAAEQQIEYQRSHDVGTGFLNRSALEHQLDELLTQLGDTCELAVLHIGFANVRQLQARLGYHLWDDVLKQLRERIGPIIDAELITARPTSTNLTLVLKSTQLDAHLNLLCHKLIHVGQAQFQIEGVTVHLNPYIGVALSRETHDPQQLLSHAVSSMIACKDSGYKVFFHSPAIADDHARQNQLENYLLHAVRNNDLMLYFQPKVSVKTQHWVGAEALLRWKHPVLGEFSNETLIHMAEQNGLIFEVGHFVLHQALKAASDWLSICPTFRIAINVSSVQLKNSRFVEQIHDLLTFYHFPAHQLELEITESGLIVDEPTAIDILNRLHGLGVTLSLDDFGTGYASFQYLKKFPFDGIKIDKSFLEQIEHSENDQEIVRSMLHVAKKLKLKVVAEGIETKQQEQFILEHGCDIGQGFLYGRPMPSDAFEQKLKQHAQGLPTQE
ncbi:GGDEF and EAL domain-containing protein [Vibrio mimicus]|uniref:sensor domain-containing phosphodiesterase n=1 Tax=Vibrio mimicus TaxID=674 RepID=UPI000317AECF|nr:GGDEF and EAL domain-containing protein [Vibrio mimicus]AOW84441.1 diguanylate cyclase [Vibrio mimicus]